MLLKDEHLEANDAGANHLMKYDKVPILTEQHLNQEDVQGSDLTKTQLHRLITL